MLKGIKWLEEKKTQNFNLEFPENLEGANVEVSPSCYREVGLTAERQKA